jgi:hypothetical protein
MMDESPDWQPQGVSLRLDPEAESADPTLPAFLARPQSTPVYHGFAVLEESRTADGWCFGSISDFDCPEGRNWGDAFIVAPDGSRAGIVWEVGAPGIERIMLPDGDRWGVYQIEFERAVHNRQELVELLLAWLPELRRLYHEWRSTRGNDSSPIV